MPPNNDYTKDMRVTDGIVRRARVINLFGASGSGKSTLASGLHYELKKQWAQAEMAREFAKDVVHQETTHWFQQAILVLAEQSSPYSIHCRQIRLCHYGWATDAGVLVCAQRIP